MLSSLTAIGGNNSSRRQTMAVSSPVSDLIIRYMPRCQQSSDHVEEFGVNAFHTFPSYKPACELNSMVHISRSFRGCGFDLPSENGSLLRSCSSGILPSHSSQFLLRSMDRITVFGLRSSTFGDHKSTTFSMVYSYDTHFHPGAQDLWAMDVRRAAEAIQGGESV